MKQIVFQPHYLLLAACLGADVGGLLAAIFLDGPGRIAGFIFLFSLMIYRIAGMVPGGWTHDSFYKGNPRVEKLVKQAPVIEAVVEKAKAYGGEILPELGEAVIVLLHGNRPLLRTVVRTRFNLLDPVKPGDVVRVRHYAEDPGVVVPEDHKAIEAVRKVELPLPGSTGISEYSGKASAVGWKLPQAGVTVLVIAVALAGFAVAAGTSWLLEA